MLGGALVLWQGTKAFVQWAGTFDFVFERFQNPSWIGAVMRFLADPPPWLTLLLMIIGLLLIYWDTRGKDRILASPWLRPATEWLSRFHAGEPARASTATPAAVRELREATADLNRQLSKFQKERKLRILDDKVAPLLDDMLPMINLGQQLSSSAWNAFRSEDSSAEYKADLHQFQLNFIIYGRRLNELRNQVAEYDDVSEALDFPEHEDCVRAINRLFARYGVLHSYVSRDANSEAMENLLRTETDALGAAMMVFMRWLNNARAATKDILRRVSA